VSELSGFGVFVENDKTDLRQFFFQGFFKVQGLRENTCSFNLH